MSYALITGASKGIGKSFAEALGKKGMDLLLVARSESLLKPFSEELKSKYKIKVSYFATDLSVPGSAGQVSRWCNQEGFKVSILINNAGYGIWGRFEQLPLSEQQNMMQLNMVSLAELTHYMLPVLKTAKQSYILNVASTTAYQAVPCMSLYAASKSFVVLFSRGLRYELRNSNVSVSVLSPGTTSTHFMERAKMEALEKIAAKFSMDPDVVANIGLKGMFHKKAEIIPGFVNKFTSYLSYYLPKAIFEKAAAGIYEKNLS